MIHTRKRLGISVMCNSDFRLLKKNLSWMKIWEPMMQFAVTDLDVHITVTVMMRFPFMTFMFSETHSRSC